MACSHVRPVLFTERLLGPLRAWVLAAAQIEDRENVLASRQSLDTIAWRVVRQPPKR
jgi:hypothetical protein